MADDALIGFKFLESANGDFDKKDAAVDAMMDTLFVANWGTGGAEMPRSTREKVVEPAPDFGEMDFVEGFDFAM
ncbi:hypothetical protein AIOL_004783 [Candidatus Rhodobacter oscarellae]|uniref:Uncharacterized protein n=1 Tax=Candidatus Rhodobacter oscarellae TaxID=1675527 RepID=A0A0J9EDJ5_9RHOB|nr:hypothetical protein [Candidatus Rhodobacter lobularis]KMW59799.1 hypothetical protein AIOL_004783 [Candidatus Rhodobacter lobularis]